VEDEDRRLGRAPRYLVQRRQAALGELVLGEAAHDPDPLRRRCAAACALSIAIASAKDRTPSQRSSML
jgi:hypothetical protein